MAAFLFRRIIQAIIVIVFVTILVFLMMRILPGDPIRMVVTQNDMMQYSEAEVENLRHQLGLDRSLVEQYFDWVGGVFRGDLGNSILNRSPVGGEIIRRIPITMHLGITAFIISIIVGIPAGIICAVRRGKWIDTLVTILANFGITMPSFWLGIILVYIFALKFSWLPVMGYTSPFSDFWLNTKQLIMPVFCLSIFPVASAARQTRSAMLEVLFQDYIRTAWSKGLKERAIILRHALKNALIPVITLKGMTFREIIGGSVIIETVFNIPGMGRLAVNSVINQDYPYVQGVILFTTIIVVASNLIVDVSYGWLDPRVRYS
jgi:peptide/nickel transport system permease protein